MYRLMTIKNSSGNRYDLWKIKQGYNVSKVGETLPENIGYYLELNSLLLRKNFSIHEIFEIKKQVKE